MRNKTVKNAHPKIDAPHLGWGDGVLSFRVADGSTAGNTASRREIRPLARIRVRISIVEPVLSSLSPSCVQVEEERALQGGCRVVARGVRRGHHEACARAAAGGPAAEEGLAGRDIEDAPEHLPRVRAGDRTRGPPTKCGAEEEAKSEPIWHNAGRKRKKKKTKKNRVGRGRARGTKDGRLFSLPPSPSHSLPQCGGPSGRWGAGHSSRERP